MIQYKTKTFAEKFKENRIMWLMLLPAILFIVTFAYIPMGGVITAFKDYKNQLGILGSPWVGLENFKYLLISNKLGQLTRNTLAYNAVFIVAGMFCEVFLAIIISELPSKRWNKLFQSLTFLPFFISWVVVAAIMMAIFGYENGVVNTLIQKVGGGRIRHLRKP
ncbi:hypothetical protein FACS1894172_05620 [Spirochaetia bacterium]|nr:hypothetical protein FACS1894164_00520 [Spirochaetia bacterium]GHU31170.1 hypothetical protein FACS1894172_05620 [Spirochaetia bacterium]